MQKTDPEAGAGGGGLMDKAPDAFRTISEVAEELDLPQHVLRFWETRFNQIRPLKRGGGRRYYRPDDVDLLKGIRRLLYDEGYTIKGVQRILRGEGTRFVQAVGRGEQRIEEAPGQEARDVGREPVVGSEHEPRHDTASRNTTILAPDLRARLQAALGELEECERVLAALRSPSEA
jgi:DNA-binding transcriptional MerR regulator